jgi:autoinducer 2-degrading protein
MFVIAAQWYAKEGRQDEVARLVREMIPHSRSEPGCKLFIVNRSADDPRKFLLYEQFVDKAAFEAHTETQPFKDIVLGRIVPLLENRVRDVYDVVEP